MAKTNIITSLDIGTSSTRCLIAEVSGGREIDILGVGRAESKGLKKGNIVNIDAAAVGIREAVEAAEVMAGVEATHIVTGIGGDHIQGVNSKGVIGINSRNKEITTFEVDRVLDSARSVRLPSEREVIHIIPQEFSVDEQEEIKNPVGMTGTRLEAEVHMITGSRTSIDNLQKAIKKAGFVLEDVIVNPFAASEAVLLEDEKEMGVMLIDIGSATTEIIVYVENAVWHTAILPVGGGYVTNDIAMGLRMPVAAAEEVKIDYGSAFAALVSPEEVIEIPSVGTRPPRTVERYRLADIIQPRMEEIFAFVVKELEKAHCRNILAAGAVLTGGASLLQGTAEIAEEILGNMTVRVGHPSNFTGMVDIQNNPAYATSVGLILAEIEEAGDITPGGAPKGDGDTIFSKVAGFFDTFFK